MTLSTTHSAATDRLVNARQHRQEIADDLERKIDALQRTWDDARINLQHLNAAVALCDDMESETASPFGIHRHINPVELSDCDSKRSAGRRIAEMSAGRLKLADAARLIYATGTSGAKNANGVKSNLYGMVSNSDEWEKDENDVYHLLTYHINDESQADRGGAQWPDGCSTNDSGGGSPRISQDDGVPVVGRVLKTA